MKPANILFRSDGTPLLSDFGIAKDATVDKELTSTGTILGSPFYMSPEQAEGLVVDGRTDIYSLGVIYYEMLTGEKPYEGDSAIKVIMKHIQSPVPTLPPELDQFQPLLNRMMAKDREQRIARRRGAHRGGRRAAVKEVEGKKGRGTMTLHALKLPLSATSRHQRDAITGTGIQHAAHAGARGRDAGVVLGGLGAFMIAQMNQAAGCSSSDHLRRPPPELPQGGGTSGGGARPRGGGGGDRPAGGRPGAGVARPQQPAPGPPHVTPGGQRPLLLQPTPGAQPEERGGSGRGSPPSRNASWCWRRRSSPARTTIKAQAYITLGLQVEPHQPGTRDPAGHDQDPGEDLLRDPLRLLQVELSPAGSPGAPINTW